jgi:hypothetical protein
MSEHTHEDQGDRIFRASLSGWQTAISRRDDVGSALFAPGRGWLEGSIVLAAFSILVPMLSLLSILCSLGARRAHNSRWLAALIAAIWCGILGVVVRTAMGMGVLP